MACARLRDLARGAAALAVVAAILTVASGCGDDSDDAEPADRPSTTDDTSTTAPPTTAPAPEAAAEATYLEFVETVNRLLTTNPDPEDQALARLAIDPVLGALRDSLTTMRTENHIVQKGPQTSHQVLSTELREPDVVVLRDCSVGNDTEVDQDDGTVIGQGLSTRVLEVTIEANDGEWKVRAVETIERFDGEVPCSR